MAKGVSRHRETVVSDGIRRFAASGRRTDRGAAPPTAAFFFVPFSILFAALVVASCIFSPPSGPPPAFPVSETVPYDTLTTDAPDVVVELYEPYLDASLGPGEEGNPTIGFPARVREHGTGRVVEYRPSRQGFGSWNAARERRYHLFLLRAFFFHAGVFDDTTGTGHVDSLYARARRHDAYTRRIDSSAAEDYRRASRTTVRPRVMGFQVRVNDAGDTVFLELVAPGSPAHDAGLRRGMPVLAVDDSVVTGDSAAARFVRFAGADTGADAVTKLTVGTREGPRSAFVGRDTASFPTVQADSIGGAGYIAVYSFTRRTVNGGSTRDEFRAALAATRRYPATVIDLRDNGGGDLAEVLSMCDEILGGGVIISLVERNLEGNASLRTRTDYRARPGHSGEGRSYVLLANRGSASASEIFIAALRENLDVPFVGTRTYGKGVGQATVDTPGDEVAIVTYGTARTASGADYNGTGLQPTQASTAAPDAMLREAAAMAVPGALARRAASGLAAHDTRRAPLMEWNRRQAVRPDVVEWGSRDADGTGL